MSDSSPRNELLDAEELLHLALKATKTGDGDQVLGYLKRILETEADNAMALYLIGAQHAQMGMFQRAKEEMARAIELEPNMPATAHFQLGLLHLTSADVPQAMDAWAPLDPLGKDDPLYLFKHGLTYLVQDEFAKCIEYLEKGIAINDAYPALNPDMQKYINKAREAQDESPVPSSSAQGPTTTSVRPHQADLSAYEADEDD
jgi:tetratricopeptide (TPR) repeat protein